METLKEYKAAGYGPGKLTMERGYISRKTDWTNGKIHISNNGKGEPYVVIPCNFSTQFCFRGYLKPLSTAQGWTKKLKNGEIVQIPFN